MAQYAVHKVGFFYTDECFAVGRENGTILGITRSMEEAVEIKNREDIASLKRAAGISFGDFYFENPNSDKIVKELTDYFQSEFNTVYNEDYPSTEIPENLTDEQAARLLQILELRFHNIVEYGDEEEIDPSTFEFDEEAEEISGF